MERVERSWCLQDYALLLNSQSYAFCASQVSPDDWLHNQSEHTLFVCHFYQQQAWVMLMQAHDTYKIVVITYETAYTLL